MLLALLAARPLAARCMLPTARACATASISGGPRLLLTSGGLTTPELEATFQRMLPERVAEPRIAMLVTAQMAPSGAISARSPGDLRRRRWADAKKRGREVAAQVGLPVECIDCTTSERTETAVRALAADETACIWVPGGETFFLWHHVRRSGIGNVVRRRVLEDGLLYVGASAGSIIAGRDCSPAFWKGWDDPKAGGSLDVDWAAPGATDALGLVGDASFFPHYTEEYEGLVAAKRGALGHDAVCLRDEGPAFVVGDQAPRT